MSESSTSTEGTTTPTAEPSGTSKTTKPKVRVTAEKAAWPFPDGYPKRVLISSLPERARSLYQGDDAGKFAVAIAPGVWSEMPPGMSILEVVVSKPLDGDCSAVDAYESEFKPGPKGIGTCW